MNNKKRIFLVGIISLLVISLVFLLPITINVIVGYIFGVVGIVAGVLSMLLLTKKNVKIPQDIAFPIETRIYLISNLVISFFAIELEFLDIFVVPYLVLLVLQVLLLAFYSIRIIALSSGKEHIDSVEVKVASKVFDIQMMLADLSTVKAIAGDLPSPSKEKAEKDISGIYDALRNSDPMSQPNLEPTENSIKENIAKLKEATVNKNHESIATISSQLQKQIQDRNNRVKLLK